MKTVIIVLDTCRRDHLSCYGYSRKTSPNIDKLASQGVIFNNAYTCDVPTIPSFTAMLNGRLGIKTGVISFNSSEIIADNVQTLPFILHRNGVATAAVSTLFYMRGNLVRGFQYHLNPMAGFRERTQTVDAEEIMDMAIPWLKQNYKKDFFFFVHCWDPHVESVWGQKAPIPRYKAPPGYEDLYIKTPPENLADREYVISHYDANIAYADKEIGKLLKTMDNLGITDETLVVFTTDHGEDLGEDHPMGKDLWDHLDIYEPVVHTPLIMRYPKVIPEKKKVDAFVMNVDIASTVLDINNLPIPADFDGKSLIPMSKGEISEAYPEVYVECGFSTVKRAVITGDGWKFIRTYDKARWSDSPSKEIFDLKKDPEEQNNVIDEEKDLADQLEMKMMKWVDSKLGNRPDPLRLRATMGGYRSMNTYVSVYDVPREPSTTPKT